MKSKIFKYIGIATILMTGSAALQGCRDDFGTGNSEEVIEGLPAIVSLKVTLPEMTVRTREAGTSPDEANKVNNLWVGIFDQNTKKKTGEMVLEVVEEEYQQEGAINLDIPTVSGNAYIVGVANAKGKKAALGGGTELSPSSSDLLELLREVDNWDDYNKVITYMSVPTTVGRQGSSSFVMSGTYSIDNHDDKTDTSVNEVTIKPANNELDGEIRLHCLDAYNLFKINVAENITFEPVSWQIVNIPALSYVAEQPTNASDDYISLSADFYGLTDDKAYHDSEEFGLQLFEKQDERNYSFDFYIRENKHTGIIKNKEGKLYYGETSEGDEEYVAEKEYNYREREFKDNELNTGWYKSLVEGDAFAVPSGEEAFKNNNATFVVVTAKISYYYSSEPNTDGSINYEPVGKDTPNAIFRTATVSYAIHLGYCEKKENNKKDVNDFNCRRNTKYTYTVTIKGVDNVRVEAMKEGETQPGAEGIVTDLNEHDIALDSHYGVVNIQLSDEERKNLVWLIQAPYGNEVKELQGGKNIVSEDNNLDRNQFYNWIQIRPTTAEDVIAPYPGDRRLKGQAGTENIKTGTDGVWYLDEFCDPDNFRHTNWRNGDPGSTKRWYTIFIDEYVYDADDETKWGMYVNNDERKLWLIDGQSFVSYDKESTYNKALYLISQESIQSYYSPDRATSCFGIESTNESYVFADDNTEPWTFDGKSDWEIYGEDKGQDGFVYQWDYAEGKTWDEIYGKFKNRFRMGLLDKERGNSNEDQFYIPGHENEILNACLARNRDLNNNNKIDIDEVRWYLPTDATYTRIMLGAPSLRKPLFAAKDYDANGIAEGGLINAGTGRPFSHYAASNSRMLWAEELAATSPMDTKENGQAANLRCIRNMGIKTGILPNAPDYETAPQAYILNEDHTIELKFYRSAALRDYTSNALVPHSIVKNQAYASRKFQYAETYCKHLGEGRNLAQDYDRQLEEYKLLNNEELIPQNYFREEGENLKTEVENKRWTLSLERNSICEYYYEKEDASDMHTWRVPNISELAMMYFLDVLEHSDNDRPCYLSSSYEYFNSQKNRYMGISYGNNVVTAYLEKEGARVWCVRDVMTSY